MERVTGVPLHERWFDPTWFSEEKRRTIFSSLVSIMSQLETIEFARIDSIYCNEGEYTVGPLIASSMAIDNEITAIRGPYNTVHSFLMDTIAHSGVSERIKASFRLLAGSIPDERLDGPPFVLSMPDYDSQNVYVDDEGNVTGLIDWDDIVVGPRQAGFSRYPLWIMRDIEPDGNGFEFQTPVWKNLPFPPREEIQQDWPDVMPGYRAEFVDVLKEVNSTAVVDCTHSHLVTALIHEISAVFHFGRIQDNLSDYMFLVDDGSPKFLDAYTLESGFERGEWMKHYLGTGESI